MVIFTMKFRITYLVIAFIILFIIAMGSYVFIKANGPDFMDIISLNKSNTSINTSYINNTVNNTSTAIDYNATLYIPPNDYVINHINWSNYPDLQQGYVHDAQIADPTGTDPNGNITHKYIDVGIYIEIKNDDPSKVLEEIKGVARETRTIYGPNSCVMIFATKNGVLYNYINTLPYTDQLHGEDGMTD
jgi:hypothetical protein